MPATAPIVRLTQKGIGLTTELMPNSTARKLTLVIDDGERQDVKPSSRKQPRPWRAQNETAKKER